MNKHQFEQWIATNQVRVRQKDIQRIKSMIQSSTTTVKVISKLPLDEESSTIIFRELYESIRQLGDATLWLEGYEPLNHEVSMKALESFDIKNKILLNHLSRFKSLRNDINYRGYKATINQTKELQDFWKKCGEEIIQKLEKKIK